MVHSKVKPIFLAAMTLLLVSISSSDLRGQPPEQAIRPRPISIIGHRGAAGLTPENTLSAFRKACEIGVDGFELDVLLSADDRIAVYHDFNLKPEITRTPTGEWIPEHSRPLISELTWKELQTYDVGRVNKYSRYARRYPDQTPRDGEKIPSLRGVMELLKDACDPRTQIWVEIKTSPEKPDKTPPPEDVAMSVVAALKEANLVNNARVLSFDWRGLKHIQMIAPEIPTVYLSHVGTHLNNIKPGEPGPSPWMAGVDVDDVGGSIPKAVKVSGGHVWAPHYTYLTPNRLNEAHDLGLQVYVWTVDSPTDMVRFIKMGVDGIITNRPDILKETIGKSH